MRRDASGVGERRLNSEASLSEPSCKAALPHPTGAAVILLSFPGIKRGV